MKVVPLVLIMELKVIQSNVENAQKNIISYILLIKDVCSLVLLDFIRLMLILVIGVRHHVKDVWEINIIALYVILMELLLLYLQIKGN